MRNIIAVAIGLTVGLLMALLFFSIISVAQATQNECVLLTWHRTMICEWPIGQFTNYTAGEGDVVLAGTPHDNRWNNQYFQLSGHLVNNGSCTMLVVDKATACSVPTK